MKGKAFALILLFFNLGQADGLSHLDRLIQTYKTRAKAYNKHPDYNNFVKQFVKPENQQTREYLQQKYSEGQMHGKLPLINVEGRTFIIGKNRLEVVHLEQRKFSLNNYTFVIKPNMTVPDRFKYIARILRSQQVSSWWQPLPSAFALFDDIGSMFSGVVDSLVGNAYSGVFGETLEQFNRTNDSIGSYGINSFTCNPNSLNFALQNKDSFITVNMMSNDLSAQQQADIISKYAPQQSGRGVEYYRIGLLNGKNQREQQEQQRQKARQAIEAMKDAHHRRIQTLQMGKVSVISSDRVDVRGDGRIIAEDSQLCIPGARKDVCTYNDLKLDKPLKLQNQFAAFKAFYKAEYDKIVEICNGYNRGRNKVDIRVEVNLREEDFEKCPEASLAVKKHIDPYWNDLEKVLARAKQLDSASTNDMALAAYSCFREEGKEKDGCCQAIQDQYKYKASATNRKTGVAR
ncbi:MAG: hypothetical protein KDD40_02925 [Bdellovibrionales bacterium]|nr:hypothetical protein [Bdellovibrionales bacterium]